MDAKEYNSIMLLIDADTPNNNARRLIHDYRTRVLNFNQAVFEGTKELQRRTGRLLSIKEDHVSDAVLYAFSHGFSS